MLIKKMPTINIREKRMSGGYGLKEPLHTSYTLGLSIEKCTVKWLTMQLLGNAITPRALAKETSSH